MSPSCQPYTVLNPDAKGAGDKRALSFIHVIEDVLPSLVDMGKQPRFMLVENVAGFEVLLSAHLQALRQGLMTAFRPHLRAYFWLILLRNSATTSLSYC
jgi:site-specific DNA-cytosine methylase